MRRKEREVTDITRILKIINACDTCRIGLAEENRVYIVPLSFGYTFKEGKFTLYFHCSVQGRKMELLQKSGNVTFEMDTSHMPIQTGEEVCSYTMLYQSVMGEGKPVFFEEPEEKRTGLRHLLAHYGAGKGPMNDEVLKHTCVFCIEVTSLTCKENL